MTTLKIYQVDAFAKEVFSGNPAAVCPLTAWLSDDIMQKIAEENNLAETVFYVPKNNQFEIRWFTPTTEVDLCGHATLAAAYVIFNIQNYSSNLIEFFSHRSGKLTVEKNEDLLTLNFPTDVFENVDATEELKACFNILPSEIYKGKTDYMLVFDTQQSIENIVPNFSNISNLPCRGVIITSKGTDVDFVSRFFAPQCGINEDPVTGSAHTTLIPYWSKQLNKTTMTAIQLSARKGFLTCVDKGDRVEISGKGKLYLVGEIYFS
jgi:PhzF family phenazine biosynthesis protein